MKTVAVIPAAGAGRRMPGPRPKQYILLDGKPLLAHTLAVFQASPDIDEIVVVTSANDIRSVRETIIDGYGISKATHIIAGGKQRQDSVRNGLAAVAEDTDIVLIHDGVRPFVSAELLQLAVKGAAAHDAVTTGMPVKDTIKKVDNEGTVIETIDRQLLWLTQTPQAFRRSVIMEAYRKAERERFYGTDDAALVERLGWPVKMIAACYENIKVTTPEDMLLAERILREQRGKS